MAKARRSPPGADGGSGCSPTSPQSSGIPAGASWVQDAGSPSDAAPAPPRGQAEGVPPLPHRGFPTGMPRMCRRVPSPRYLPSPLSTLSVSCRPRSLSGRTQRYVGLGPGKRSRAMRDICLCASSFSSPPTPSNPPQLSWGHGVMFLPGCGERREEGGSGPPGPARPQLAAIPAPGAARGTRPGGGWG